MIILTCRIRIPLSSGCAHWLETWLRLIISKSFWVQGRIQTGQTGQLTGQAWELQWTKVAEWWEVQLLMAAIFRGTQFWLV
eukprot:24397_5